MNEQDTLLILTPGFAKDEADTTCLPFQQYFLKALKKQYPNQDVLILAFQYPYEKKSYRWHGIDVISFGGKNKGRLYRLLLWRNINKQIKKIKSERKIGAVLSFWCGECALIGKKLSVPHFCWIPGQDAKKENRYVKRINPNATELVAFSDFIADEFERNHGIRPAHIIPPGINPTENNLPEKDIDILGAGSLIPLKQYSTFLEVIAAIKKSKPHIKAVIAGEGPERKHLEELIIYYQLENNVTLKGEVPHDEVLQLMERSKIFLHPSSYEGFGIVNLEALNAGCQVISFCQPMKQAIPNWHIVSNKKEMVDKIVEVTPANERILFNTATAAVDKFFRDCFKR